MSIARLTDALFDQLDRHERLDPEDTERMNAEIERARAVHLVSGDIIETGRLTLAAAEMVGRGINSPLLEKLE